MDSAGEQHLSMEQNIHKRRLDLNGNPIAEEEPKKQEIAILTNVNMAKLKLFIYTYHEQEVFYVISLMCAYIIYLYLSYI